MNKVLLQSCELKRAKVLALDRQGAKEYVRR